MPRVQARLLSPCPVPPAQLGQQPRPCGHRNAPSLGGHLPTSSIPSPPASRSVNANTDPAHAQCVPAAAGSPAAPRPRADKQATTSSCSSLHRSGRDVTAPRRYLLRQVGGDHRRSVPTSLSGRTDACVRVTPGVQRQPAPSSAARPQGCPFPATNLRHSRRSRWSRSPRGCWSCRHRALSPRAPRP